jgi:hypothetical protein
MDGMPSIGTVIFSLLYFAAAWLVWSTTSVLIDRRESALWYGIFAVLIVLAINRLLGDAITDLAREYAIQHGWYFQRRIVQAEFIAIVAILCWLVAITVLFLARHSPAATQIALIGIVTLIALAFVRDTSLHQIDYLIHQRIFGLRVNWILDLGGLALVLLASGWRLRAATGHA